jgi:hypothetical protein
MADHKIAVNRTLAGVLAAGCLIAGGTLLALRGMEDAIAAAFIRVGLMLGALWCAMPTRHRDAAWANVSPLTILIVLVVVIVFARMRWLLPIAIALAAVGYFIRPRNRRRGSSK